jgi:hypothetical protein
MFRFRQRFDLRVPDRLAVAAALVLSLTALGGVVGERGFGKEQEPAQVQLLKSQAVDTQSDDAVERHGAKARLLLFRRG